MGQLLSIGQTARVLGVTPDTVRAWEEQGRLKSIRTEGDHRRFDSDEVHRLAASIGRPVKHPGLAQRRPMLRPMPRQELEDTDEDPTSPRQALRSARAHIELLKSEDQVAQILNSRKADAEREATLQRESQRMLELKEFGRSLALCAGLPAEWRATQPKTRDNGRA